MTFLGNAVLIIGVKHLRRCLRQWQVAERLFGIATDMGLAGSVAGFYTEIEEYNAAWWLGAWDDWAEHYLGPVSTRIK